MSKIEAGMECNFSHTSKLENLLLVDCSQTPVNIQWRLQSTLFHIFARNLLDCPVPAVDLSLKISVIRTACVLIVARKAGLTMQWPWTVVNWSVNAMRDHLSSTGTLLLMKVC